MARARRANNHRPPDRDSLLGAGVLSAVLHATALVATLVVWPLFAPLSELQSDIVPVEALTVAEFTNIMAQQESKEPPPPDPQPVTMPPIETAAPAFEEPPPPPAPDDEAPALDPEEKPPEPEPPKLQPPQPRFALAQPRMKPKPEKPKDAAADFEKTLAGLKFDEPAPKKEPQRQASQTIKGVGAQSAMTMSEIDALRSQMEKCWNMPAGAPDPTALVLRVRVFLNEDGTVASPPELIDQARLGDPYFRAAADAAKRAVHMCAPYNLPPEKYASWNEVVITFDPSQLGY